VPEVVYSKKLVETVKRCLTVAPEDRPDVLDLCGGLTEILLVHLDNLRVSQTGLQRKLDRERKRTQK
jgi:NIMA (never in mitosis gene a)-related kinase